MKEKSLNWNAVLVSSSAQKIGSTCDLFYLQEKQKENEDCLQLFQSRLASLEKVCGGVTQ